MRKIKKLLGIMLYNGFAKYLPKNAITKKEIEDFLFKCVEEHYKRIKQREMTR